VEIQSKKVRASDALALHLATSGGAAIRLHPVQNH